jgi:hypothetical protein
MVVVPVIYIVPPASASLLSKVLWDKSAEPLKAPPSCAAFMDNEQLVTEKASPKSAPPCSRAAFSENVQEDKVHRGASE